jgi:ribosomal protein L4
MRRRISQAARKRSETAKIERQWRGGGVALAALAKIWHQLLKMPVAASISGIMAAAAKHRRQ